MINMLACVFNRYQNGEGEPTPVLKPLNEKEPKSRRVIKGYVSSIIPTVGTIM